MTAASDSRAGTRVAVAVETPQHSGVSATLDYLSEHPLAPGTLVRVPLGKRTVLGIVWPASAGEAPDGTLRPVAEVLDGIAQAQRVGLGPIKVNMVVKRGTNDHEIVPMARHFRENFGGGIVLRFIEYMDVGATNGWRMDEVLPSAELLQRLQAEWPLMALDPTVAGETAERWRYADGRGEVGLISSVTQAFCRDCNRARLSTEGKLFLCLFATRGHDLRALLRQGAGDADITSALAAIWAGRDDRYSELRAAQPADVGAGIKRVEMSYIGG